MFPAGPGAIQRISTFLAAFTQIKCGQTGSKRYLIDGPGDRCNYIPPRPLGEGKIDIHHCFCLKTHTYIYMYFKELDGKCRFDHFLDKTKMPSKFLLVRSGKKIENTGIFKGREFAIAGYLHIIIPLVHSPASRHHHAENNLRSSVSEGKLIL